MDRITKESVADIFFQINWANNDVQHTDTYAGRQVNFWRDHLSRRLYQALSGKQSGDQVRLNLTAKELMDTDNASDLHTIPRKQFDPTRMGVITKSPRGGRFYPRGFLSDMPGIFRANVDPFRCLNVENGEIKIDMGHPLFDHMLALNLSVGTVQDKLEERGGSMQDWNAVITDGVGMQSRWQNHPTDFFDDDAFVREDESSDTIFYKRPRLVPHIDDTAIDMLQQLYARFLADDIRVLDLMSSWQSHIPSGTSLHQFSGIGLNETELQHNPALSDYQVRDLNKAPRLPYDNAAYDVVLCSLSVEYLTHPKEIFADVARVLRPGGYFVVTFSNRWFAPKAIGIWNDLHEFERMGLVLEYFQMDNLYHKLHTYSVRGLARPTYDKYYRQLPYADPVYAIWGQRSD